MISFKNSHHYRIKLLKSCHKYSFEIDQTCKTVQVNIAFICLLCTMHQASAVWLPCDNYSKVRTETDIEQLLLGSIAKYCGSTVKTKDAFQTTEFPREHCAHVPILPPQPLIKSNYALFNRHKKCVSNSIWIVTMVP